MRKKGLMYGILVMLLLMFVLAASGCSDKDEKSTGQEQSAVPSTEMTKPVAEAQSDTLTAYADGATGDAAAPQQTASDRDNSGAMSYVECDQNFDGVPDVAYLPDTYYIVPVFQGDTVEFQAQTDRPAKFLLGADALANHYIVGDVLNSGSAITMGEGTEFDKVIKIDVPQCFFVVFAVQDEKGGNNIVGNMKIIVNSQYSKDYHWQNYNTIMKTKINTLKAQNKVLDQELENVKRAQPSDDQIKDWFSYA